MSVLALDRSWVPNRWVSVNDAIVMEAKGLVLQHLGEDIHLYRGGINALTGKQSSLITSSIIVVDGEPSKRGYKPPALTNTSLFQRDRNVCAYCGGLFTHHDLTRDHIHPTSKGGKDVWMNVVTSCKVCNSLKGDLMPGEKLPYNQLSPQGTHVMDPLFVPYVPCKNESMILRNRSILVDQMLFLAARITNKEKSRVYRDIKSKYGDLLT